MGQGTSNVKHELDTSKNTNDQLSPIKPVAGLISDPDEKCKNAAQTQNMFPFTDISDAVMKEELPELLVSDGNWDLEKVGRYACRIKDDPEKSSFIWVNLIEKMSQDDKDIVVEYFNKERGCTTSLSKKWNETYDASPCLR